MLYINRNSCIVWTQSVALLLKEGDAFVKNLIYVILTLDWRASIVPQRASIRNDSFSYFLRNWQRMICEVMSFQGLVWNSSKEQYVAECLHVLVCVNIWVCDAFVVKKHSWLKNTHSASQRRLIITCDSASSQLAHQNFAPLQGSFRYSILTF